MNKEVKKLSQSAQNRPLAAVYVRVSTEDQALHGFSLAGQEDVLKNYATVLGYEIYQIYKDEGKSAKDIKKRPAMQQLLLDAEQKKFSAIFIYKLDRFSRSLKDLILTIDKLKEWNIDFVSLQDKIETASASGKLMFHIISAFAEFERNIIGERTTFGMQRKSKEGGFVNKPPFGYKMVEKNLEFDSENALKVHQIFEEFLSSASLNQLAKRHGFSVNGLKKILSNRVYLGEVKFAGKVNAGNHKPLIGQELFDKVQFKFINK
ncbi:MAG: recombinase family protein [Nanoarchaeota archaeon]